MKCILIVDDAKSIQLLLAKCMELNGFSVKTAGDGKTALEMLIREQFALVFLDIKLPIISGTEVLRRMREKGINVPVIIITAFGNIKNAVDCTRMGAISYVQKPFTSNRISAVLNELNIKSTDDDNQTDMHEARSLMESEKYEEVEKILKNLLPTNPFNAEVYHMLAEICLKLNREQEAEQYEKLCNAIK